jgi:hypothetical protein
MAPAAASSPRNRVAGRANGRGVERIVTEESGVGPSAAGRPRGAHVGLTADPGVARAEPAWTAAESGAVAALHAKDGTSTRS